MWSFLNNSTDSAPLEYADYVLIRDLYHCTPLELEEQDQSTLDLHREFMRQEAKWKKIESKRSEQEAKLNKKR